MDTIDISLNINDPEIVATFDNMYVDFYLEDDMFEIEGQFFTIDGQLYIEVHDAVMHILEMAGKELKLTQIGRVFTATRPDGVRYYMAINRVYYKLMDPTPDVFKEYMEEKHVDQFFLKLDDVMVEYSSEDKKWKIVKNKINMYYIGDIFEYDTLEELYAEHAEDMKGEWQACIYEAYEEESDYTSTFCNLNY